jgi:hypothetical protein
MVRWAGHRRFDSPLRLQPTPHTLTKNSGFASLNQKPIDIHKWRNYTRRVFPALMAELLWLTWQLNYWSEPLFSVGYKR